MKNIINLILAIITITILAIATVFTVVGIASLDSTPYTGIISVCSGLMLFAGTMYAMMFLNPFVELKKSWNILVSTSTLWGDRAGVPIVVHGNVNVKETEMQNKEDAWKKQAERMTEELVKRYEERGLVIEEMGHKINELRGSEMFYCNFARVKTREVTRLKEELLNLRRDVVNLKNEIKDLNAELEGEKRGAVDMIMSLTNQIKRMADLNRDLNEEIKMSHIKVVKNDSTNYNDDWQLVHAAEKLIESAKGKTGNADQVEDIYDLKAKVSLARNYAAGKMDDKYIPSNLKESIKAIMATINNWLI